MHNHHTHHVPGSPVLVPGQKVSRVERATLEKLWPAARALHVGTHSLPSQSPSILQGFEFARSTLLLQHDTYARTSFGALVLIDYC